MYDSPHISDGIVCGTSIPSSITVPSHEGQVSFKSDKYNNGLGFRLEWRIIGNTDFVSVSFHRNNSHILRLRWNVKTPNGNHIDSKLSKNISRFYCLRLDHRNKLWEKHRNYFFKTRFRNFRHMFA